MTDHGGSMRRRRESLGAALCLLALSLTWVGAFAGDDPSLRVLRSLDPVAVDGTNVSGNFASNRLLIARDRLLYGTTPRGGANNCGTVFRLNPRNGNYVVLHTFAIQTEVQINADGCVPTATLIQARDGALYGSTQAGGINGTGVLFRITTAGVFSVLYTFPPVFTGGASVPVKALVEGADGNLYGVTSLGGSQAVNGALGEGTLFMVSTSGAFVVLHSFDSPGPKRPSSLIRGRDGFLYGTTSRSNSPGEGSGSIFRFTPGFFETLYNFAPTDAVGRNPEGAAPFEALIETAPGQFDGVTSAGGASGAGTIFRFVAASRAMSVRHAFGPVDQNDLNADGFGSNAPLVRGDDGNLYSTQPNGGPGGGGVVYRIKRNGRVSVLHAFALPNESGVNRDGATPQRGVIVGSDGNLYGGTAIGGAGGTGTLFRLTIDD